MPFVALAIPLLTPLLLAPHLLFYYDITPKVAMLLFGAAAALILMALDWDSLAAFSGTHPGRVFLIAAAASLAVTALATLLSTNRDLAWYGSNWRRMGAVTEFAILLVAIAIAAYATRTPARLVRLLQSIAFAGLLASLYGIAQYFGYDPILPAAQYHVGEGIFEIVRPPSTLGHSDYFAAFLLWPIFAGLALFTNRSTSTKIISTASATSTSASTSTSAATTIAAPSVSAGTPSPSHLLGAASAITGVIAILLSGSRGAVLALAAGLCILFVLRRPRLRTVIATLLAATLLFAAFYISPAGQHLRARVHWIADDPAGGARLQLWRDSLKMAAAKPITGFGPENFVAEFPHYQSQELERAYPDFYNESPHNLFLDVLTSEGALGVLALLAIITSALTSLPRAPTPPSDVARTLVSAASRLVSTLRLRTAILPAFAAALIAHQFIVFTATNAFFFYLGAALLAGASSSTIPQLPPAPKQLRYAALLLATIPAVFLSLSAYRLLSVDAALATVQRQLDANHPREAADSYRQALALPNTGLSADLYFSRRFAALAIDSTDFNTKLYDSQIAAGAASLATHLPENQANAWYNLSVLAAGRRDPAGVELCLRNAIAAAPVWYKPHWILARLLAGQGHIEESEKEARLALAFNGSKDPEVASSLQEILRSQPTPR